MASHRTSHLLGAHHVTHADHINFILCVFGLACFLSPLLRMLSPCNDESQQILPPQASKTHSAWDKGSCQMLKMLKFTSALRFQFLCSPNMEKKRNRIDYLLSTNKNTLMFGAWHSDGAILFSQQKPYQLLKSWNKNKKKNNKNILHLIRICGENLC